MAQFWTAPLNSPGIGAGTALASSTTLTDISPAPQLTLPANWLYVGQRLRAVAYGIFSTTGTPTLLLGAYYGGVAGTAIAATGATTTQTVTTAPFRLELDLLVKSLGSSGTVWANGKAYLGSLTVPTMVWAPATQTMPVTVNTTVASALTLGAQWGTSSASNTITCEDFYVETLG